MISMWDDNSRKGALSQACVESEGVLWGLVYYFYMSVRTQCENTIACIQNSAWYALMFVFLAVAGLAFLLYEFTPWATPQWVVITSTLDFAIACIFFSDFILGMIFNGGGKTYRQYVRDNWVDLLASIPLTYDMARALRIFRIFKALRIISASVDLLISKRRYKNSITSNR